MYEEERYHDTFAAQTQEGLSIYVSKVFGWMFLGLIVTALASFFVLSSNTILTAIFSNPIIFYGLIIGELILVFSLSRGITKMDYGTAKALFIFYSALNGVTLSAIFIAYTMESISYAFVIAAVTFGVMSIYGYVTKNDLTRAGSLFFMGLIGMIVLSVVNIFLNSSTLQWVISVVSLFVFLGLTAYDTQKIKAYYYGTVNNEELRNKVAIIGALSLYLDFVNLFLSLLRIFGKRR